MPWTVRSVNIPVGPWVEQLVDWLRASADALWDAIRVVMLSAVDAMEVTLAVIPPVGLAVIFAIVAWRSTGRGFGLFTLLAFLLIDVMGLWTPAMRTLAITVAASAVAALIGLPLGILASRHQAFSTTVRPILDFMQTLPPFVYLIPAIFFFQVGIVPGVVATLVFATPPAIRLTELGIREVPGELIEAGHAFGATANQILFKIQFPMALPTIMAGVNQVIMLALSMAVIAGMVGSGGLGGEVIRSLSTLDIGLGFEAGVSVVFVAIFLDRLTEGISRRLGHRSGQLAQEA